MLGFQIGNWSIELLADRENHLNVSVDYYDHNQKKFFPRLIQVNHDNLMLMTLLAVDTDSEQEIINEKEVVKYTDGYWKFTADKVSANQIRICINTESNSLLRISEMVGGSYFRADTRL